MADGIARANIEHLRKLLAAEKDEAQQRSLTKLLAEEEQKLAELFRRK
jgi:hypothetical protein